MGARKELRAENRYVWDRLDREIELRIAAEDRLEAVKALYEEWGNRPQFEPNRKLWTALGRILNGGAR